jgi:hypothetical protein
MSRGHLAAALAAFTIALALPAAARADSFPLVGWWPLNEGAGQTVRDWSGHGNNGYLGTTPAADANDPSWVKGVFLGSALRFDGLDDNVTIPASTDLQPQRLTVAAWVRGDGSPGAYRYFISQGDNGCTSSSWGLYTGAAGGLQFYITDTPDHYILSPAAPMSYWDGNWHNVAGTFDGKLLRLYVDGKQIGTGTLAPVAIDYSFADQTGQIGNAESSCPRNLTMRGDVDGVQVWSQALPIDTIWRTLKSLFSLAR